MPWSTPTLEDLRQLNRDNVTARLRSGPLIPNSDLRVMADSAAGLAYLTLLYLDWLALQLLPDTAETEWLDRWARMFLVNADGSKGRKAATFATGTATVTGISGTPVPSGTFLDGQTATPSGGGVTVRFQTTAPVTIGDTATTLTIAALDAGAAGNLERGSMLSFATAIAGVNGNATVVALAGGADAESDDELRARLLDRIRQPPMGGDANDYVQWALDYPGVTRAWCSPLEMGIGTITLRFMMDDLRAAQNGFPNAGDVAALQTYIDGLRPVTALDVFVVAPIPFPISFTLNNLDSRDAATVANITASVTAMLKAKAAPAFAFNGVAQPAQTIYAAWVSDAVLNAVGVVSFDLVASDWAMPGPGNIAVLGNILLG